MNNIKLIIILIYLFTAAGMPDASARKKKNKQSAKTEEVKDVSKYEKKAAYPDYRKAKQEMQELLIVQANVAKILGAEPREAEHEKEQKQR